MAVEITMAHRLSWQRLLSESRPARRDKEKQSFSKTYVSTDERTAFEQDYDRIVFSEPFRRLARKTQVHPLATNDHIHNRLTHSIEVASVGRSFARRVAQISQDRSDLQPEDHGKITWILQTACLIHDLGNPPFGHAGEEVVRVWAEKHAEEMFDLKRFENEQQRNDVRADWLQFEGNAQGFRLAASPDNPKAGYLRLTHATLASAIKYPWLSTDPLTTSKRKHNVYTSERDMFLEMAEDLGLLRDDNSVCRHPLSFLTEAADDICYRIIDLEDAVEMGIEDPEKVHELFLKISGSDENRWMRLPQLRGQAIKTLMDKFWNVFEADFENIMNGERTEDLKSSVDEHTKIQMEHIRKGYEAIFGHSKKVAMEIGAYHILGRILKAIMKTVNAIHDTKAAGLTYDKVPFLSKRCAELAWGRNYVQDNFSKPHTWWLEQMKDFACGMTDDYATALSGEIGGHSFFNR